MAVHLSPAFQASTEDNNLDGDTVYRLATWCVLRHWQNADHPRDWTLSGSAGTRSTVLACPASRVRLDHPAPARAARLQTRSVFQCPGRDSRSTCYRICKRTPDGRPFSICSLDPVL